MDDIDVQKAIRFAIGCFRKTTNPWKCLYSICEGAALKFGVLNVQVIVDAVKERFKPKPRRKWYTCCYKVHASDDSISLDRPHVRENTNMINISAMPMRKIGEYRYQIIPIHAYKTKSDALKSLKVDYDQYVIKYHEYLQHSTQDSD